MWRNALGIWFRALVASAETALLARGRPQLELRKGATVLGGGIASASLLVMTATASPVVAMLALTGVTLGNSFNQSGFLSNYLELAGPDSGCKRTGLKAALPVLPRSTHARRCWQTSTPG